jgi:hypothetical protein
MLLAQHGVFDREQVWMGAIFSRTRAAAKIKKQPPALPLAHT